MRKQLAHHQLRDEMPRNPNSRPLFSCAHRSWCGAGKLLMRSRQVGNCFRWFRIGEPSPINFQWIQQWCGMLLKRWGSFKICFPCNCHRECECESYPRYLFIYIYILYIYMCVYIYPTWCPQLAATSHLQRTLVPGCEIRGRHAGHSGTADRNIVQFLVTHHIPQYRHLKLGSPILQHSRVSIGWSKMVQIIFSKVVHPINIHQLVSPRSFVGLVSPH